MVQYDLLLPREHLDKLRVCNPPELSGLHRIDDKKSDHCGCKHVRHPWAKVIEWCHKRISRQMSVQEDVLVRNWSTKGWIVPSLIPPVRVGHGATSTS